MKIYFSLFIFLFFLISCTSNQINLEDFHNKKYDKCKIFESFLYEKNGLPVFSNELKKRPENNGNSFYVIYYEDERPIISYNIIVDKKDNKETVKAFFKYTMELTESTKELSKVYAPVAGSGTGEGTFILFGVLLTSTIALPIGGMAIDIIRSPYVAYKEINRVTTNPSEIILAYTVFIYDELKRLKTLNIYASSKKPELLMEINYNYKGRDNIPYKTTRNLIKEN